MFRCQRLPKVVMWLTFASLAVAQSPMSLDFSALRRRVQQERTRPTAERIPALQALARFDSSAARTLLLDLWKGEGDETVRGELLALLGQHADPAVAKVLRAVFEEPGASPQLRQRAADGLVGQGPTGLRVLARALGSNDDGLRAAARSALAGAADKPEATRALAKMLVAAKGEEAYEVLFALRSHHRDASLTRWLREHVNSKERNLALESVRQLADLDAAAVRPLLGGLARDPAVRRDVRMHGALAYACVVAREPGDLDLVLDVAALAEPWVRYDLGWLTDPPRKALAKDLLDDALRRPAVAVRVHALELLDFLAVREPLGAAVDLALADTAADVVYRGLALLNKYQFADSRLRLERLLGHESDEVRAEAAHALHPLRRREPAWVQYLMSELRVRSASRQMAALDLLADLQHLPALTTAQEALFAEDWRVRSAACRFCARVRHKSSIPLLIERLDHEHGRLAAETQAALVELSGRAYEQARFWRQWWDAAGAAFKLEDKVVAVDASARTATPTVTAAATYYEVPVVSERVCFVIDVSGSMVEKVGTDAVTRLAAASEALLTTLRQLARSAAAAPSGGVRRETLVDIVVFDDRARAWSSRLRPLDDDALASAKDFIAGLVPSGGTNMHAALQTAFADMAVDTVYLLSDGEPSLGAITDPEALAAEIARWNRSRRVTIHTIAIGTDSPLLRQLAMQSGGIYLQRK